MKIRPASGDDAAASRPQIFLVLTLLLAIIGYSSVWLYLNYDDRGAIAGYWGRVVATGLLGAIALTLGARYEQAPERSAEDESKERQIGVGALGRNMVAAAYAGVATWRFFLTANQGFAILSGTFAAIILFITLLRTRDFLEQLERRHHRVAASPVEWGWLVMSLIAGQGLLHSGFRLLGAGVATAIAIPFTLYLRRREEEVLALLPPDPAAPSVGAEEGTDADGPWDGLPPIKRLL